MKWSKEKENDVDTLISFIIGEIDNKCKSGELPDWVVDQVEKRLEKINIHYEDAKRIGFRAVGFLIVSLLSAPVSMIFAKGDINIVFLGVFYVCNHVFDFGVISVIIASILSNFNGFLIAPIQCRNYLKKHK